MLDSAQLVTHGNLIHFVEPERTELASKLPPLTFEQYEEIVHKMPDNPKSFKGLLRHRLEEWGRVMSEYVKKHNEELEKQKKRERELAELKKREREEQDYRVALLKRIREEIPDPEERKRLGKWEAMGKLWDVGLWPNSLVEKVLDGETTRVATGNQLTLGGTPDAGANRT